MAIVKTLCGEFEIVNDDDCIFAVNTGDDDFYFTFDKGTPNEEIIETINEDYKFNY